MEIPNAFTRSLDMSVTPFGAEIACLRSDGSSEVVTNEPRPDRHADECVFRWTVVTRCHCLVEDLCGPRRLTASHDRERRDDRAECRAIEDPCVRPTPGIRRSGRTATVSSNARRANRRLDSEVRPVVCTSCR